MIRSIKTIMRQDREPYRIPRRVQDVIPIQCVWPDGIFKVGIKFSKTYRFTDINYKVAGQEDKETMFRVYSELLNSLDCAATTKLTICNRRQSQADFEQSVLMPMREDGLDKYRREYNQMLMDKATGANGITQEKYVTITVYKRDIEDARAYFTRIGADLTARFAALGSKCVELDATASFCPLCHTRVLDPGQPVDTVSPKPFPTRRGEVAPAAKQEVALLITAMLASVAMCCGVLNLFLRADRTWSLYVIGAAAMLWLWLVPPLLARGMHLLLRLLLDIAAVALYVYLISVDLNGGDWYLGLAAPIILWGGAILLLLGLVLRVYRRSALTTLTILIGSIGVFVFGMEFFVDRWLHQLWSPSWSLVVLTICIGMVIPLIIIRRVPALREEARRRFHL